MNLTEDEISEKYAKHCGHCKRNTLLPYDYEFTCIACGFNVIKTKHELSKKQRKKTNFINRLKYAEHKIFCICIDVYKFYEGDDYDKIYEVLSELKNKKIKIKDILIEKYKNMNECQDFEQDFYSRRAKGIYKNGYDSIGFMKWMAYYDKYYENTKYFDLLGSICNFLINKK